MCIVTYPCQFLNHLSPTELTTYLTLWADNHSMPLYPVWLHNDGENLVGLLPKTVFYSSMKTKENHQLTIANRNEFSFSSTIQLNYHTHNNQQISLDLLVKHLTDYSKQQNIQQNLINSTKFTNGLIGFIGYDICASTLDQNQPSYLKSQISSFFGHYDIYLTCQIIQQTYHWQLHITTLEAKKYLIDIEKLLIAISQQPPTVITNKLVLQTLWQKTDYQQAFDKTQDYLIAGDCYQINLTQCWQGKLNHNVKLVNYLSQLHQATQAPFAGFLAVEDFQLLSCSPELFFTFSKNNEQQKTIITKPIKGTRPRGKTNEQDLLYKNQLTHSKKDQAENVMIVDLLRNDLGKYAVTGSVHVPKLFDIESFSNVHHMVSTICATLKADVHPLTVLFGSLPAGSITGTPKKRAVQIIHELEAEPRGAYCGTLGFMNFDGTGQWNVLIRTLQADKDTVSLWAGGGITVASDCQAEYQECFDKVNGILSILASNS